VVDERTLQRLHRRLLARSGPQAIVCRADKFDLLAADSPRLAAMLKTPAWASRVLGVFSPDVPIDVLRGEVAA
jgi:hypothetical protein